MVTRRRTAWVCGYRDGSAGSRRGHRSAQACHARHRGRPHGGIEADLADSAAPAAVGDRAEQQPGPVRDRCVEAGNGGVAQKGDGPRARVLTPG
jgi:hypothetical protein